MVTSTFRGIGYVAAGAGLPLTIVERPVPVPQAGEVLIEVLASSLNPLEYKLADLNFLGREPPVVLGFDLAGRVKAIGPGVRGFDIGDAVLGMADCDRDGGWAEGGPGFAIARACLLTRKPDHLSFLDAATLPVCFLAAHLGLVGHLAGVRSIYIPGGDGGVGHLAIQIAKKVFGIPLVISSAGRADAFAVARASGADAVLDRSADIPASIADLTGGSGVDLVFDATYSESSFVETAGLVRKGGTWSVLGVGPGRTTRTVETESPVASILGGKGAVMHNANVLSFFDGAFDGAAETLFTEAMRNLGIWTNDTRLIPHVGETIAGTAEAISLGLEGLKTGKGAVGKTAVLLGADEAF
jgi:NADPH:quinone reductase-like Zn-dependent oxidoreductase